MSDELKNFIHDLVWLIQERYNETLEATENEIPEDTAFRHGQNFAYYNDLDLIESQLKSMGF